MAPLTAFAQTSSDHAQAELRNAQAQLTDAIGAANGIQAQAQLDATNERMIALARLQAMRVRHPDSTGLNAAVSATTTAAVTDQPEATAIVDHAKASLANAMAMVAAAQ